MVCITVSVCRRRKGLTLSHDPVIESLAFVASSIQCGERVRRGNAVSDREREQEMSAVSDREGV